MSVENFFVYALSDFGHIWVDLDNLHPLPYYGVGMRNVTGGNFLSISQYFFVLYDGMHSLTLCIFLFKHKMQAIVA